MLGGFLQPSLRGFLWERQDGVRCLKVICSRCIKVWWVGKTHTLISSSLSTPIKKEPVVIAATPADPVPAKGSTTHTGSCNIIQSWYNSQFAHRMCCVQSRT